MDRLGFLYTFKKGGRRPSVKGGNVRGEIPAKESGNVDD